MLLREALGYLKDYEFELTEAAFREERYPSEKVLRLRLLIETIKEVG